VISQILLSEIAGNGIFCGKVLKIKYFPSRINIMILKIAETIAIFPSKYSYLDLKQLIITLLYKKVANFSAENWRK
jgi:hypothetical protein